MTTTDRFDYSDLEVAEQEVKYKGKTYIMTEASGGAAKRYRNALMAAHVYGNEGTLVGLKDMASVEPLLVSLCLFELVNKNGTISRVPVQQATVESWPARMQKDLFKWIKDASKLSETAATERELLGRLLTLTGTPVSLDALREFADAQEGSEYEALKSWLKPTDEESAKNLPSGTETGSS